MNLGPVGRGSRRAAGPSTPFQPAHPMRDEMDTEVLDRNRLAGPLVFGAGIRAAGVYPVAQPEDPLEEQANAVVDFCFFALGPRHGSG